MADDSKLYEWWKQNIPSSARLYLQTLFGDRTQPFTEKDFTANELKNLESIIQASKPRLQEKINDIKKANTLNDMSLETIIQYENSGNLKGAKNNTDAIETMKKLADTHQKQLDAGSGNVQYEDYKTAAKNGDLNNYNAIRGQTLGKFQYKTDPITGQRSIIDNYDFSNTSRDSAVNDYSKMSPVEKALAVAKNSITSTSGETSTGNSFFGKGSGLLGEIGNAYIGKDGRPVDIKYDPNTIGKKKGGFIVKPIKGGKKDI